MIKRLKYILMFAPVAGLLLLSSCGINRNSIYFNNLKDSTASIALSTFSEPLIQADDILSITIQTIDPTATSAGIQMPNGTGASGSPLQGNISGYLVDGKGEIQLPMIGRVKLVGLTTTAARELILDKAKVYLKDPVVQVRFANFKITVIGEVNRPATYTVASEKVSILDVIGMAGDLTIYGRRENILLIRHSGDHKETHRLNLASSDIIESPYFYLRQNDVIYVEPNNARLAVNNTGRIQLISVASSLLSIVVVLLTRF